MLRAIDARLGDPAMPSRLSIGEGNDAISACLGHVDGVKMQGASIALGGIENDGGYWAMPGAPTGDGTYALFRVGETAVELATDVLATRTIWYHHDDDWLIASTSQRALVMLLGSFHANRAAVPWMLANGVAGPCGGWDRRLCRVPPDCSMLLDRATWRAHVEPATTRGLESDAPTMSDRLWESQLETAVRTSVERLDIKTGRWLLPLSGGYDSRLLATVLAERRRVRAVTWGRMQDACQAEMVVAAQLANKLQLPHDFIALTPSADGAAAILDHFIRMGEGLTDSVAAYLDGFRLWRNFADADICGILRGDEPFGGAGWAPVHSPRDVRLGLGLALLTDRPGTAWLAALPDMAQDWPKTLDQAPGEPLESWRHRLYRTFRVPVALAALTETKTAYVEVLNPLQSRRVVDVVRVLPDRLRTDKRLLITLTRHLAPALPYASLREGDLLIDFLHEADTLAFLRKALDGDAARALLPDKVIDGLLARLPTGTSHARPGRRPIDYAKRLMPRWIKRRLKRVMPDVSVDPCLLAFRAWIAVRAQTLLAEDAAALGNLALNQSKSAIPA